MKMSKTKEKSNRKNLSRVEVTKFKIIKINYKLITKYKSIKDKK